MSACEGLIEALKKIPNSTRRIKSLTAIQTIFALELDGDDWESEDYGTEDFQAEEIETVKWDSVPWIEIIKKTGFEHRPTFTALCAVGELRVLADASSKKVR